MHNNNIIKKFSSDINEISNLVSKINKNQKSKKYIKFLLILLLNHFKSIKKIQEFYFINKNFPTYFACNEDLLSKNKNYLTYEKKKIINFLNFFFKLFLNYQKIIYFPGYKHINFKSKLIYKIQLILLRRVRFKISMKKIELFKKSLKKEKYFGLLSKNDLINILPHNTFVDDANFTKLIEINGSLNASLSLNNYDVFFFLNKEIQINNYFHGAVYGEYLNNQLELFEKNLSNRIFDINLENITQKKKLNKITFEKFRYLEIIWVGRYYNNHKNINRFLIPDFYQLSIDISYIDILKKILDRYNYKFVIHPRNTGNYLNFSYLKNHKSYTRLNVNKFNDRIFVFDILSHSLIYELINKKKQFLIFTKIPNKNITNNFKKFISILRRSEILFDISEKKLFKDKLRNLIKET